MREVSTPIVSLFPEVGMEWGLWANKEDLKREGEDDFLQPSDLNLSAVLTRNLGLWNRTWVENYGYGSDESFVAWWKDGFDVNGWLQEGLRIAERIETEADVAVERKFANYLHRPIPLVEATDSSL